MSNLHGVSSGISRRDERGLEHKGQRERKDEAGEERRRGREACQCHVTESVLNSEISAQDTAPM